MKHTNESINDAYLKLEKIIEEFPGKRNWGDALLAEVGQKNPMIAKIIKNEIAVHNDRKSLDWMAIAMIRLAYVISEGEVKVEENN